MESDQRLLKEKAMKLQIRIEYSSMVNAMRYYLYADEVYLNVYNTETEAQHAFEIEKLGRLNAGETKIIREEII